jgi:hypothetical protein
MNRRFNAPPAAVFDAWTNPEVLRRWFAAGPEAECAEAMVDEMVHVYTIFEPVFWAASPKIAQLDVKTNFYWNFDSAFRTE